jgi:hypothetical protein
LIQAETEDTAKTWVLLKQFVAWKAGEVCSSELAERIVRKELAEQKYQYRYLDIDGLLHEKPIYYFWQEADIDFESSLAIKHAKPVRIKPLEPLPDFLLRDSKVFVHGLFPSPVGPWPRLNNLWLLAHTALNLQRADGYLQIYKIEVLAPQECVRTLSPAKPSEPTEPKPALSVDPFRSGNTGRPSGMHLVRDELTRRISSNEVKPESGGHAKCARDLETWWGQARRKHTPPGPPLTCKTIVEKTRDIWLAGFARKA